MGWWAQYSGGRTGTATRRGVRAAELSAGWPAPCSPLPSKGPVPAITSHHQASTPTTTITNTNNDNTTTINNDNDNNNKKKGCLSAEVDWPGPTTQTVDMVLYWAVSGGSTSWVKRSRKPRHTRAILPMSDIGSHPATSASTSGGSLWWWGRG